MLRSDSLFGKGRDATNQSTSSTGTLPSQNQSTGNTSHATTVMNPPKSVTAQASSSSQTHASSHASEGGSELYVGPNIKLKGVEIDKCNILRVEGIVEANVLSSDLFCIEKSGKFTGSADVEVAEFWGEFDGK